MADLGDLFTGTPPTYGVQMVGGGKSPLFDFAKYLGGYLKTLVGQPLPSYQGQLDPGMSPTMAGLGQMLQAFSQSPLPNIMGQAGGVLGRFMNPSFANPMARMQLMGGNAPQFFNNPFMGAGGPHQMGGGQPMPLPPWLGGGGQSPPFTPPWMQPPGGGPPGGMGISPMPGMGGNPGGLGGDPGMMMPGSEGPMTDIPMPMPMPSSPSMPMGGGGMQSMSNPTGGFVPGVSRVGAPPPPPSGIKNMYMPKRRLVRNK